jgi:4-amino-4-deoxy-L-arabinose transferase-like glycosyltransferase
MNFGTWSFPGKHSRHPSAIALGASGVCLILGFVCFPFQYFEPDTAAYVFQAKLFAQGMLAAPAPPDFGFSPSPHINIYDGLWFSKYPFGTSLLLGLATWLGLPWLLPPLATGLTLLFFFGFVTELFGRRVAMLSLLFAALSPAVLIIGATQLSQSTNRLCIAIFLWTLLRSVREESLARSAAFAAAAGLALGYSFNTRPLVAVVFASVGALLVLIGFPVPPRKGRAASVATITFLAFLPMLGLFLAWNAYFMGDPWKLPYHALQAADRMGFGLRGEGYAPYIKGFRTDFTAVLALTRLWQHTIPCVLFHTVGWGSYRSSMFLFDDPERNFPLLAWVLLVTAAVILTPLFHRSRSRADLFCGYIFLATVVSLFFQYSDHTTWGSTPLHSAYYNEAILFGLIPLAARGSLIAFDAALASRHRWAAPAFWTIVALLFVNTLYSNLTFARALRKWDPYYQRLPALVAQADLHQAVVFVPHSRNAPIGDFPFAPLDVADIVYFRTGPLPEWGLNTGDWRIAYAKYFARRSAYIFDGYRLVKLNVVDETDVPAVEPKGRSSE